MSKALIKAFLRLLAIVAKEDGVSDCERIKIEEVLRNALNKKHVPQYLQFFDDEVNNLMNSATKEDALVVSLCNELNRQLTRLQKSTVLIQICNLIMADGVASYKEAHLLDLIRETLLIERSELDDIQMFIICRTAGQCENPNLLVIDNIDYGNSGKFRHLQRPVKDGFLAVLFLESSNSYFIKNLSSSEFYLNGIPLNQERVIVLPQGSSIRGKMEPIYFGDIANAFNSQTEQSRLTVEAKNISYKFSNGNLGLRNIHFSEESGNLLGLMGASGAGKSTLLNLLNGTTKPSNGQVLINGIDIHKNPNKVKGVIGYIPQDDLLQDDLTVFENLFFAAKLCFKNLPFSELKARVNKTLESLGLSEIKNLKVGSPIDKVISGGQRKRVNIALELLREPTILFVDEPTSGLSSRDSEIIMDLLKELALSGKVVFVVIHQPSSHIFKMFDHLLILDVGGYQIYYGNPVDAVLYFKDAVKLVDSEQGECDSCGNVNPEQVFDIIENKVVNEYGWPTRERKVSPKQWSEIFEQNAKPRKITPANNKPKSVLNLPTWWNQVQTFMVRDLLSKISNKQYILINLFEAPVLALILSLIVRDSDGATYEFITNNNIPSYLFMSIIVALFMGLTVSAEEIIKDNKILKREAFLSLSKSGYITSKLINLFFLSAIQTFLFVLVGNTILEIKNMYFIYWLILFSTSCFANVLGLNISSAMKTVVTVYILIPILLIPQILLSGVVVQFDKLHKTLKNEIVVPLIGDTMISRWALEAAMVAQFTENEFEKQFYDYEVEISSTNYKRLYYIPQLVNKLNDAYGLVNEGKSEEAQEYLNFAQNALKQELDIIGYDKFPEINSLTSKTFNIEVYDKSITFLDVLKSYYIRKQKQAKDTKNILTSSLIDAGSYNSLKTENFNEQVFRSATNSFSTKKIIEHNNQFYQVVDPIYMTIDNNKNLLNYRTPLYSAQKQFLGLIIPTPIFNIMVMWFMTGILALALYYEWLKKLMQKSLIKYKKLPSL